MKLKKLIAMALVAGFALSNVVTVSAAEMTIAEDSSTEGTVPSEFNVDEDVIGAGVVVRVPANLDLTYDSQMDAFRVVDTVGAKGIIRDWYSVTVSIADTLIYHLTDSEETVEARVRFGEKVNGVGTEAWSSAEVALGANDDAAMDCRTLIIDVSSMDVTDVGSYSATAEFAINLAPIGMYSEISAPVTNLSLANVTPRVNDGKQYASVVTANVASLNLSSLPAEFFLFEHKPTSTAANTVVKYIEMNADVAYAANLDSLTNINSISSWIMNMEALSLVVVPSDITTENIKRTYTHDNSKYNEVNVHDYHSTVFTNTNTVIGDALAFCKGIDSNGLYIYVPHIVYRGTADEWRALSGHDDWVFGNAANVVKVHCTDEVLTY